VQLFESRSKKNKNFKIELIFNNLEYFQYPSSCNCRADASKARGMGSLVIMMSYLGFYGFEK